MNRRPWIVVLLAMTLVGAAGTPARAVTAGDAAAQAVAAENTVSPAPMAAALDSAGNLNAIRTRGDGVILRDQKGAAGRFLGWQASSGPTLVAVAAEADAFVAVEAGLDAQGNVYVSRQTNGGSSQWTAWQVLNDLALTSIALARNADGRLEMIGTNFDGAVIRRTQNTAGTVDPATGWGLWSQLTGPPMRAVAAEAKADGRITMVGIGMSGALAGLPFVRSQMAVNNTNWFEWLPLSRQQLPAGAPLHSIAVARSNDNLLKVFAVDDGDRHLVIRANATDGSQWDPSWAVLNDGHGGAIAAQGDGNGTIHLFGSDGAGTASVRFGVATDTYGSWRPLNQYAPVVDVNALRRTALVIRAEWSGHTHGPAGRSVSEIAQMVNSDHWWPEVSYGHFADFTVSTVGQTVAIPAPDPSLALCSPEFFKAISDAVDPVAASRSRDPKLYDKVVYYLPHLPCMNVEGRVDAVGGSKAYIVASTDKAQDRATVLHELGHLLGLQHAAARRCIVPNHADLPVPLSDECRIIEYGDPIPIMADSSHGLLAGFAASQRALLGWMDDRIVNVPPPSGVVGVTLSPIELTTVEPGRPRQQALRIDDNGTILWVELREPVGVDAGDVPFPGVYIHQELSADTHSYLLDMTPGSLPEKDDFLDARLPTGSTWVNPLGHIAITVQSADTASAVISLSHA